MFRRAFALLLLPLTLLAGCMEKKPQGKAVAHFAGETVTDVDFMRKAEALPSEIRSTVFRRKQEFLDDLVGERILLKEAKQRKIDQDPEVSDLIQQAKNKILIARLIQLEIDRKVELGKDEAERYYDLHKDEFMTSLMLRASHILVKTHDEADAVRHDLDAGADFEETARHKSIDPTAIRGGDLGFFQKGQFVREFEEAVFGMKKGEVKGPIESQFGWHVIKLTDRVEPTQRSFEAVKSRIEEKLLQSKRSTAFHEYIKKIKGNIKVDVDQKVLDLIVPAESKKSGV